MKLKLLELFGGIGACTEALKRSGVDFEVVDYVEIDKYACGSYNAMNHTNFTPQDIVKWDKDAEVDMIMHGSPCQDFSIAGTGKGGDKSSNTRSSLMYETIRIVEKLKPKVVLWENVKNLLSAKHRHNFDAYLQALSDLGYTNYYKVLNAKEYANIPQNRERIFTISIRGGHKPFIFPEKQELNVRLKDVLEQDVDEKFFLSEEQIKRMFTTNYECGKFSRRVTNENGVVPTLCARDYKDPKCVQIAIVDDQYKSSRPMRIYTKFSPTLTCNSSKLKVVKDEQNTENEISYVRKLTPKETWRLMGFSDSSFSLAEKTCSNGQLYKQAGNSIVVNLLMLIIESLKHSIEIDCNTKTNNESNKNSERNKNMDEFKFNEYQEQAKRFINSNLNKCEIEYHALHGMVGEIGELHSIYQKVFQGHTADIVHKKKELGDLLWFIAEYCTANNWDMSEIAKMNIDKLSARYPNGFEVEKSLNRKPNDI